MKTVNLLAPIKKFGCGKAYHCFVGSYVAIVTAVYGIGIGTKGNGSVSISDLVLGGLVLLSLLIPYGYYIPNRCWKRGKQKKFRPSDKALTKAGGGAVSLYTLIVSGIYLTGYPSNMRARLSEIYGTGIALVMLLLLLALPLIYQLPGLCNDWIKRKRNKINSV